MADVKVVQKKKPKDDEIEDLDMADDNFLKLENYDLSKINEIQRKIASHADYENLNQNIINLDDNELEKHLKIDSVAQ